MDKSPLLLTMNDMQNRLKLGEVYKVQTEAFSYTLSREGKRYILVQGDNQPTIFRSLEDAVITMLNCIGHFKEQEKEA